MQLIRLANVIFDTLEDDWKNWSFSTDSSGIQVGFTEEYEGKFKQVVFANTQLKYKPKRTKEGLIVVPSDIRENLEELIETSANLVSVANRTPRKIISPDPPVAFMYENDEEKEWLESSQGIQVKGDYKIPIGGCLKADVLNHLDKLNGRMDGISLLSEAICHQHLCGKFHEYFRLFERGFKLSSKKLIEPMVNFFENSKFGYDEEEIQEWVRIRHSVTHADVKDSFLLEKDLMQISKRMEQAAYDVLFNKENWRSDCTKRRELWDPQSGTSKDATFVTQGSDALITLQLLDDFGIYARDLAGILNRLPEGMWYKRQEFYKSLKQDK